MLSRMRREEKKSHHAHMAIWDRDAHKVFGACVALPWLPVLQQGTRTMAVLVPCRAASATTGTVGQATTAPLCRSIRMSPAKQQRRAHLNLQSPPGNRT